MSSHPENKYFVDTFPVIYLSKLW